MDFANLKSRFENMSVKEEKSVVKNEKERSSVGIIPNGQLQNGVKNEKGVKQAVDEIKKEWGASEKPITTSAVSNEAPRSSVREGQRLKADMIRVGGHKETEPRIQGNTVVGGKKSIEAGEDDDDDDEWETGSESFGEEGDGEQEGLVRQESNFSRLSAQSWESVESAEMIEDGEGWKVAETGASEKLSERITPAAEGETERGEGLQNIESVRDGTMRRDVLQVVKGKDVQSRTVLECAVELLGGMAALKKKSLRRFGMRRVWLSDDCSKLLWTSKKVDVEVDHVVLNRVTKLRLQERELMLEVPPGQRKTFVFENEQSAQLWTRFLGCFVPLQARKKAPPGVVLKDKELEDYDIGEDIFDGKPLRQLKTVNDYVILGNQRGFDGEIKLAMSRATRTFVGVRYLSPRVSPLLIRSPQVMAMLKQLRHPNVLHYKECLTDARGGNYVLFEYAPRGPVMDMHNPDGMQPIKEGLARELVRDIINALEYLHNLHIGHGDVRPHNLVRAVDGSVKLSPLGCIFYDHGDVRNPQELLQARLGNEKSAFIAPEMCWLAEEKSENSPGNLAMDTWSLGAVLYFMLYGRVPFPGSTPQKMQENICTGRLRFPREPRTSRKVMNFLKGILGEKDPKARMKLSGLKNHPWLMDGLDPVPFTDVGGQKGNVKIEVSEEDIGQAIGRAKVRLPY